MFSKYFALAASVAAIAVASPAAATTFSTVSGNLQGSMKSTTSYGTTYEWFESKEVNGVSFSAYAYTLPTATSTSPELARLKLYDQGFGVLGYGEADQGNNHTVDNRGTYDFVALFFNKSVQLTGMTLNAFSVDGRTADKDAWIGYGDTTGVTDGAKFTAEILGRTLAAPNGVLPNAATMAGKVGNVWLIGAERATADAARNDGFKLGGISVAAVPEPSTWGVMILGFGLAGGALRRRRTAVAFA